MRRTLARLTITLLGLGFVSSVAIDDAHGAGLARPNSVGARAIGIGGAALLAATIVFIVDPSKGETHAKQQYLTVAPSAGPTGGGVVATVRF